jgi:hypothetical protein
VHADDRIDSTREAWGAGATREADADALRTARDYGKSRDVRRNRERLFVAGVRECLMVLDSSCAAVERLINRDRYRRSAAAGGKQCRSNANA